MYACMNFVHITYDINVQTRLLLLFIFKMFFFFRDILTAKKNGQVNRHLRISGEINTMKTPVFKEGV